MESQPPATKANTGFTASQIMQIIDMLPAGTRVKRSWQGRPFKLSLFDQLVVTLTYIRTNQTQAVIAENHGIAQATVSRTIGFITSLLATTFGPDLPTADDLDHRETLIVDGTLVPDWAWADHPEDYSGKHKQTGRNLQVACSLDGTPRWISDPLPGSTHDAKAIREHLDVHPNMVADKGYIGLGIITPIRRLPGQDHLAEHQKQYNQQVGSIRAAIERCIAHLKNWKILATPYRRPWHTHPDTITTTIWLHLHRLSL